MKWYCETERMPTIGRKSQQDVGVSERVEPNGVKQDVEREWVAFSIKKYLSVFPTV